LGILPVFGSAVTRKKVKSKTVTAEIAEETISLRIGQRHCPTGRWLYDKISA